MVLVDFGGGHTKGWVGLPNYETVSGDRQGCEQIVKFMRNKVLKVMRHSYFAAVAEKFPIIGVS